MLDWLSDNRALVAAVIILCLVGSFFASIFYGLKQTRLREKDQVFGDPERTVGGWFWAVCGVSTLLLVSQMQSCSSYHAQALILQRLRC